MTKKKKCRDLSTIGGRLAYYRERAGYTQESFSKELLVARSTVAEWESNKKNSYASQMDKICKLLSVDQFMILTGISEKNLSAHADLGLCDEAIDFLKSLKGDYYIPFVTTDSDETDATSISEMFWEDKAHDYSVEVEGGYPDEMLYIINLLLSNTNGKMLLAMMYKFLTIQFGNAFVNGEPCIDIEYNTDNEHRKRTLLPVVLMKYSILQAISSKLEELRDDVKGVY